MQEKHWLLNINLTEWSYEQAVQITTVPWKEYVSTTRLSAWGIRNIILIINDKNYLKGNSEMNVPLIINILVLMPAHTVQRIVFTLE